MRALALAAVFGVGLTMAGVAAADPWTDPNGNINLNAPRGWTVRPQQMNGGGTAVLAFTPSSDCYFFGIPNAASANASVNAARNTTSPLPATAWTMAVQGLSDFVTGGPPTVTSQSVDTSGFWPVQRAELQSGDRTIYGAIQVRPGFELRGFCAGGAQAALDPILSSMSHPNDQAWQTAAAAAPAEAAPPAAETPAATQERPRRGRGMTTGAPSSAQ